MSASMMVVFGVVISSLFVLKIEKSSELFAPLKEDLPRHRRRQTQCEDLQKIVLTGHTADFEQLP